MFFFKVNLYIKKTFINARLLFGTPFSYIPHGYRSYQVWYQTEQFQLVYLNSTFLLNSSNLGLVENSYNDSTFSF
jgi:hypothetical protein